MRFPPALIGLLLLAASPASAAEPAPPNPQAVEFFEAKVRPVLVEKCFNCHGEKKQSGGLRLDSRAALLKGADGVPVVVPGSPEKSPLLQALRHEGDVKMPPKGKLPPEAVEAFTTWVKLGVPFPEAKVAGPNEADAARKHWAFQPVRDPAPPSGTARNPIDAFVQAKLREKGLSPSPPADKRTLIRRAYYDLIGLPPSAEEIEAFVKDDSPEAFAKVVDRLLASPRYGERWGRYWLDLARYSDTKGYVFTEDRNYPFAYTYRDYVIRSFNDDKPYDRFVIEQLAADRLPLGDDKSPLAAMGFLTLGRRFLNNTHDIIDDRIDVVTRSLLGLTVTCARCHDHKYDPIPSKDYYSLYGVFASSIEPKDLPLIGHPERTPAVIAFEKDLKKRQDEVAGFVQKRYAELLPTFRTPQSVAAYLLAARDAQGKPEGQLRGFARERDLNGFLFARWRNFLGNTARAHSPVFAPWHALAALPDAEFAAKAPGVISALAAGKDPKKRVNPLILQALTAKRPANIKEVAQVYGEVLAGAAAAQAKDAKPTSERAELAAVLTGANAPTNISAADAEKLFNRADRDKARALQRKVDAFRATSPAAPAHAMVLNDAPNPFTPRVFLRGNPNNPGPTVPRQFLEVIAGPDRKPFADGSGRLEMARAVASPDNPLTARVMVNRVWLGHFGLGLVRTPSDFGVRCDPPTHPELLDWLAKRFVEDGWSVKKLHRRIMLSATYQQSSEVSPELARLDPENRLLARMNRRRLDFEAMRDSLLAVSGGLDEKAGGRSVDIFKEPFSRRRTVYGFIDRQNLPGTFRTFDFASPDTHSPQRFTTTVPQQALFLLNSPFVVEQARLLAARPEVANAKEPSKRIGQLYRLVYGRPPTPEETEMGLGFVQSQPAAGPGNAGLDAWGRYAQVLLLSNEFAFVN